MRFVEVFAFLKDALIYKKIVEYIPQGRSYWQCYYNVLFGHVVNRVNKIECGNDCESMD